METGEFLHRTVHVSLVHANTGHLIDSSVARAATNQCFHRQLLRLLVVWSTTQPCWHTAESTGPELGFTRVTV